MTNTQRLFFVFGYINSPSKLLTQTGGQQHYTSLSAVLVLVSDQSHERKGLVSESWGLQDIVVLVQAKPTKERLCMVSESLALQKC